MDSAIPNKLKPKVENKYIYGQEYWLIDPENVFKVLYLVLETAIIVNV